MDNGVTNFLVLEAEGYVGGRSKTYNMEDGSINQHPFDALSETNIPLEVGSEWLYDGGDIVDYLRFETNLLERVDMKDENDYWLPLDHSQFYRQFEDGGNATRLSKEESDELYSSVLQKFNNFRSGLSGDYTLQDALDLFLGQDHQGVEQGLSGQGLAGCHCFRRISTTRPHLRGPPFRVCVCVMAGGQGWMI